jgi:CDP-4-dehydro-6-deoxyglucose reductase, E3
MSHVTLANGAVFAAEPGTTILDAALAQGLVLEHGCRTGRCGSCKARVVAGRTAALHAPLALTSAEAAEGWVLTCASEALSDVQLDIEDLGALAGYLPRVTPSRIDSLERAADDVMRVVLRLPPASPLRFLAGQHIAITSPAGVRRSYSIASAATAPGKVELHIRRVDGGRFSDYWFGAAKPNDLLRFDGPRGSFFLRPVEGLDVVFLATGTGIAPILSMLAQLAVAPGAHPRSVSLYWGGRHVQDHYLDPAAALPGLRYVPVVSRGDAQWHGARGHVQDVLVADVALGRAPALAGAAVYACGLERMIRDARSALLDAGLSPRRFHSDAFVESDSASN